MKNRHAVLAFLLLSPFLIAACGKPADFTGFWKENCTDAFGVQIKGQSTKLFSVSFCGPGGCLAPGEWMPNTPITGDPKYRVIDAKTLEIQHGQGWSRYTRCTADTNPALDYGSMPTTKVGGDSEGRAAEWLRSNPNPQPEDDLHRPPCTSPSCKKISAFLKKHYCGESPAGNGPDDSCDLRDRNKRSAEVKVIADYNCDWNESKNEAECIQHGQPPPQLQTILVRELQRLGAPEATADTHFTIWESDRVGWSLAQAYYSHPVGSDIELCEVIAVIDRNSRVTVLRELPLKKTDIDVPEVTDWSLLDIADTRGDGEMDVILAGDAYEDHWIEVISIKNGTVKTIFSGLGYYL